MKRDCPRFKEQSEIFGDRSIPAACRYNKGQSSQELVLSGNAEGYSSEKAEASSGPSTSHRVVAGGSSDLSTRNKGKEKLNSDVVLGGDAHRERPVKIGAQQYLGKSLSIQKKDSKARLIIDFLQAQAKDTVDDAAETEKKVMAVLNNIYK